MPHRIPAQEYRVAHKIYFLSIDVTEKGHENGKASLSIKDFFLHNKTSSCRPACWIRFSFKATCNIEVFFSFAFAWNLGWGVHSLFVLSVLLNQYTEKISTIPAELSHNSFNDFTRKKPSTKSPASKDTINIFLNTLKAQYKWVHHNSHASEIKAFLSLHTSAYQTKKSILSLPSSKNNLSLCITHYLKCHKFYTSWILEES